MRSLAFAVVLSVLALGVSSTGQSVGTVTGTVKDSAGAPVPGATIQITSRGSAPLTRISDATGAFSFERVPVADYNVKATLAGFKQFTTRIKVNDGKTTRLDITLELGGLTETVNVEAESSKLQTQSAATGPPINFTPPQAPMPILAPGREQFRRYPTGDFNTAAYDRIDDNPFRRVAQDPLSTFSIDVDTASYANVRRFLNGGSLPPKDAVRIEELINYFRFDYPRAGHDVPFSIHTEIAACPWNSRHRLALVGLQARPLDADKVPARNLVFLLDVSGSMMPPNRLPLIRTAMRMLVDTLDERDRIAIVVYAGASGLVLPSTGGAEKEKIHQAIARLEAGGSTNGAAGITLAYKVAQDQFVKGGINRVILATDGDFNVGITNQGDLTRLIEEKRATGIFLSVLGVGDDNLKDSTMEKLADRGNGNYAYLDSLHEARKVLVREAGATLVTVAKDVKIQVEFNPANVAAYRLIGYENRLLRHEDFNDDKKDAGEIGAGHTVTALYEIVPPGGEVDAPSVDALKYQRPSGPAMASTAARDELMTVKLRYKAPDGDESRLITVPVKNRTSELSENVGFAAAVAEFGMLLRQSEYRGSATHAEAASLARRFRGADRDGYRAEFVRLVELAGSLAQQTTSELRK
ncbi:MAG TPA: von Willebrand factor type A domain-containing protein [Vicinamibacterales bacterium]|jgi:Ca-activated chloride channel homolog|nr:von Willebrand factor type A domain-containing protein [Vicinamibacterales bacterium]